MFFYRNHDSDEENKLKRQIINDEHIQFLKNIFFKLVFLNSDSKDPK